MPIAVICDECSESHRVRDDAVRKRLKCKECGKSLKVEAPAAPNEDFTDSDDAEQGEDDAGPDRLRQAPRKAKSAVMHGKSLQSRSSKSLSVPQRKTKVLLGIRLVYIGFMLFLLTLFVAFGISWTYRNNADRLGAFLPVLRGLSYLDLASTITTTVGKALCLTASSKCRGEGVILVAAAIDLLAQAITVAKMFMMLPSVMTSSINPLSVTGMVCFVLFLKQLGRFLKEPDISERATGALSLGVSIVGMWRSIIVLNSLAIARVLPAIVGGLGVMLLAIALLIAGIIGSIR